MPKHVNFSEEEKVLDYQEIEQGLREHKTYAELAELLGRSKQYICNVKKELCANGILTEEELQTIKEQKEKEEQEAFDQLIYVYLKQGKNKTQIRKATKRHNYAIDDAISRLEKAGRLEGVQTQKEKDHQENLEKIKKCVQEKMYPEEIAKITGIPRTSLMRLLEELVDTNKIKKEDIINQKQKQKEELKKRNAEIYALLDQGVEVSQIAEQYHMTVSNVHVIKQRRYQKGKWAKKQPKKVIVKEIDSTLDPLEKEIITCLKAGYQYLYVCKKTGLSQSVLMTYVKELKNREYISSEIIKEARTQKRHLYEENILGYLKQGHSLTQMYHALNGKIEEISLSEIHKITQELKQSGKITEEEINAKKEEKNPLLALDKHILVYLKAGFTVPEILKVDPSLTEMRVRKSKERLKMRGEITEAEMERYKAKRERKQKKVTYQNEVNLVWNYIQAFGYTDFEIAPLVNLCANSVADRRRAYMKQHNITLSELHAIQRKAKEKIERTQEKEKQILEKKEKKQQRLATSFEGAKQLLVQQIQNKEPESLAVQKYYAKFLERRKAGHIPTKEDSDLFAFIVLYESQFSTIENADVMIRVYLESNLENEAERFAYAFASQIENKEELLAFQILIKQHLTKGHQKLKIEERKESMV